MFFRINSLSNFFLAMGLGFLCLTNAYANFPLPPRVSALAYGSDYAVGQADVMLPVLGNPNRNNLYIDPALSYGSDNQNEMDIGLGYRWIANRASILGGYLFGGYSRIENNARLWVINPGIEALGSRWDAHLNAYFPMGDRHTNAGSGMNDFFSGHSQFGSVFLIEQYVGNGADVKVGYQLFPGLTWKAYLGSYYFSPAQTNNVFGGAAGIEYWLTQNVKMIGSYTYDNLRHSTYAFGIGIEWGGMRVNRADPTIQERLTDPVERYLADLGRGSTIPSNIKDQSTGQTVLLADNIAFFSQSGGPNNGGIGLTLANCTFENPCGPTDFTQTSVTTLGGLLPNTQIYFNGGTYTNNIGPITLDPGQSLQSRSADFSQPATGAARSTIVTDTITLPGNNNLENIILVPSAGGTGVTISGANNVITGSQIGSPNDPYTTGVQDSGTNTLINNSSIFASEVAYLGGGNTTTIENSVLNTSATTGASTGIGFSAPFSNVTVNNSQILVNNTSTNSSYEGISVLPDNIVTLNNSTVTVNSPNATNLATTYDIFNASSAGDVVINGGALSANSSGPNVGILAPGSNPVTIQGTACQVNGTTVVCP